MAAPDELRTDEDEVLSANQRFYEALRALSLSQMDAVWLQEDWVTCLHPGWELLLGWQEIRRSWAEIFQSTLKLLVSISRPLAHVSGDTAWISCIENVTSTNADSITTAAIEATNIFVRQQGQWLMVHHHTSPIPGRQAAGTSATVQ